MIISRYIHVNTYIISRDNNNNRVYLVFFCFTAQQQKFGPYGVEPEKMTLANLGCYKLKATLEGSKPTPWLDLRDLQTPVI
jgi:hypothetical protein